jgi:hypothetical protein
MEILRRNHRLVRPIVSEPETACPVLLSPGLAEMAPTLSDLLGPDFAVSTERVGTGGVMVTGPVGPVGVAFLSASYPGVRLLVVDRRWAGRRTGEAVLHLEAGADGYLSSPTIADVASHVQALARRSLGHASVA